MADSARAVVVTALPDPGLMVRSVVLGLTTITVEHKAGENGNVPEATMSPAVPVEDTERGTM